MIDLLNLLVKGSGFIKRKNKRKREKLQYSYASKILANKTGLTKMESDTIIDVLFKEMLETIINTGSCFTPIGVFTLEYDTRTMYNIIRFNLKPQYAKKINEPTGEVNREIIFE
jgi:hypothetical protein